MFTSNFTSEKNQTSYRGVDLTSYNCIKLVPDAIYANYPVNQLHFPIGAIQKGLKPHTKIGIKRLLKREAKKKAEAANNKNKKTSDVPKLNPKSPQEICMKALRTQFRTKLEQNHVKAENPVNIKKKQWVTKRKLHQRERRNQLIRLVKLYRKQISGHFGARLHGFGRSRCPKVSREQIYSYLGSIGITVKPQDIKKKQATPNTKTMNPLNNMDIEHPIQAIGVQPLAVINPAQFPSLTQDW